jgi:hypothetical protein
MEAEHITAIAATLSILKQERNILSANNNDNTKFSEYISFVP